MRGWVDVQATRTSFRLLCGGHISLTEALGYDVSRYLILQAYILISTHQPPWPLSPEQQQTLSFPIKSASDKFPERMQQ